MRRIEHLINDVKFSSNEQSDRFKNIRFNKIFSDGQKELQRIIHTSNLDSDFFSTSTEISILSGVRSYDLPSDIYTGSSINSINIVTESEKEGARLKKNQQYKILDGKLYLMYETSSQTLKLSYTKKLPDLSIRIGKISSVGVGTLTITGQDPDDDITEFDDYFCIVDKDGVIIDSGLEIGTYSKATGVITTSSTFTSGVGNYVVIGKNATSNSELPEECEKYLTMFVDRMINYINSNRDDLAAADIFTKQEKADIQDLFAKNDNDPSYPEIIDYEFQNYDNRYY